ncbi:MAG: hypothetical protein NZ108_09855 [Bacteroidia bacterium]|nr:hypothetical protein [Bacteroidia bacterium]
MQKDKEFYIKEIERLKAEKVTITQNIHAVEKFAREAYFMKRPDEDLFILTDQ